MEINLKSREVSIKVVYYGPGVSGKTTNLEIIHEKTPNTNKGRLSSLATDQDRTLFFDYMPLELGEISGLKIRLRLFTVPGQVYYNSTRKLVLRCVDGIVFVADSQVGKNQENMESLQNLFENLRELEIDVENLPIVMQYNKRDLSDIMSVDYMNQTINYELKADIFEAIAVEGHGVFQTLKCIASKTLKKAEENIKSKRKRPRNNTTPSAINQSNDKTRKMAGTTPSGIQMPGKTKFQLSFKKEGDGASTKPKFQTTFGEKKSGQNNLPFTVKQEADNVSETKYITSTDKISLRRGSDMASETESIDNVALNNQTDQAEQILQAPLDNKTETNNAVEEKSEADQLFSSAATDAQNKKNKFKQTTTLFRGSLTKSSHLNLSSKNKSDSSNDGGLKDRLKSIGFDKIKKIEE
ncbi:ATP/GTP-binding protein [Candidatus Uabimicrobium sp. HlEnr_7]|uniref:GTP-binding protein n=1 Tax=Candidatus Uabimicrobium helgolandensis TaxID=3095367 RepID=UPI003558857A